MYVFCLDMASKKLKIVNFNVGVLGHIDSGKTSLGELCVDHYLNVPGMCCIQYIHRLISI